MIESLTFNGYKNFSKESMSGFEEIYPINLIIGKNNIGKSSLLQMITSLSTRDLFNKWGKQADVVRITCTASKKRIEKFFSSRTGGGDIYGNHWRYGKQFVGYMVRGELIFNQSRGVSVKNVQVSESRDNLNDFKTPEQGIDEWTYLISGSVMDEVNQTIVRLSADRNMIPEVAQNEMSVLSDGSGATNVIRAYLNKSKLDSNRVQKDLLNALNTIMQGEDFFSDIVSQEIDEEDNPHWETFLTEKDKGQIALSDSGSGLRTILLVLVKLFLVKKGSVYVFEELENNLHPAIQRSLFRFIFKWIKDNNVYLFLTSHSNIPIDMCISDDKAQIIHVHKANGGVVATPAVSFRQNDDILQDLGVHGSDLLQSNGIIWVEGPSDRVYLNAWLKLLSGGKIIENKHYQIMFYGGRLLAHLSGTPKNELISLLLANHNSAIIMDSDRTSKGKRINVTKNRVKREFEDAGKFVWITMGKEIENYLSPRVLSQYFGKNNSNLELEQYAKINEYLDEKYKQRQSAFQGKQYTSNKVGNSRKIVSLFSDADLDVLDLRRQMQKLLDTITIWNKI
ncbi:ATP-dependent endonuclease [Lactiplantibacillus daoliensis]|uniref:ATP-dependent endonuclease n=1 Tax=Lactiplantibacillus daoliensis TaxID=2559916 RepID=A0ABW1UIT8_9LACO|nr:AAA family ATPase [Lactiplantibacillus daoliensis]